ncbi:MAG TPA: hypothetical protein VIK75_05555 [Calditerricola sp.]
MELVAIFSFLTFCLLFVVVGLLFMTVRAGVGLSAPLDEAKPSSPRNRFRE